MDHIFVSFLIATCLALVLTILAIFFCARKKVKKTKQKFHGIEDSSGGDLPSSGSISGSPEHKMVANDSLLYIEISPGGKGVEIRTKKSRPESPELKDHSTIPLDDSCWKRRERLNLEPAYEQYDYPKISDFAPIILTPNEKDGYSVSFDNNGRNATLASCQNESSSVKFAKPQLTVEQNRPVIQAPNPQKIPTVQIKLPKVAKSKRECHKNKRNLEIRHFHRKKKQQNVDERKTVVADAVKKIHFEQAPPHQYEFLPTRKTPKSSKTTMSSKSRKIVKNVTNPNEYILGDRLLPSVHHNGNEYEMLYPKKTDQKLSPSF